MGIRTRIMLTATAILVIVFAVLIAIISHNVSSSTERLVTSEMDKTLSSVSTKLNANRAQTPVAIKAILNSFDVVMEGGVFVLDSTGTVIADSRDVFTGQSMTDTSWYEAVRSAQTTTFEAELGTTSIYAKSMDYGERSIIVYLPLSTVNNYKFTPVVIIIVVGGIGLIALISLLYLVLTRVVIQPLESISFELEELERGERIDEDIVGRNVDGKQLVSSINAMLDRLDISLPASAALKASVPAAVNVGQPERSEPVGKAVQPPVDRESDREAAQPPVDRESDREAAQPPDRTQYDAAPELLLSPVAFTLEELFLQTIPAVQNKLEEKNIDFSVHIDRRIPHILVADVKRLSALMICLIDNAVKFTEAGGSVSVATRLESQKEGTYSIMVSVTDTGVGISFEQQKQLFAPNDQADQGQDYGFKSSSNAGRSLAFSKRVVKKMGGRIWVDSVINEGAAFHFTFKATEGAFSEANAQNNAKDALVSPAVPEWAADLSKHAILVAESSGSVRESVLAALGPTGITVVFADTGESAISAFFATPRRYQMILMDLQSSPKASLEAVQSLRGTPLQLARAVPIIALGPSASPEEIKSYRSAGINDYLLKPIKTEEFFAKLKTYFT